MRSANGMRLVACVDSAKKIRTVVDNSNLPTLLFWSAACLGRDKNRLKSIIISTIIDFYPHDFRSLQGSKPQIGLVSASFLGTEIHGRRLAAVPQPWREFYRFENL